MKEKDLSALIIEMTKRSSLSRISEKALSNIQKIRAICNKDYANQSFYGNGALNRKILLDKRIAELLTPETILALFSIHASSKELNKKNDIAIWRNSTGYTSLVEALYFGFYEGMETIKLMPNNEPTYGLSAYERQKASFAQNTSSIIENILLAAKKLGINIEDEKFQKQENVEKATLSQMFEEIGNIIDKIKDNNESPRLLGVPGYSTSDIRNQSVSGFITLCKKAKINLRKNSGNLIIINEPNTLESFVKKLLSSPDAFLDGTVIHLFYDRVHLEACLEHNLKIKIGDQEYELKDILREIIKNCETSNNKIVAEQFLIRLNLVKNHLQQAFPNYFIKNEDKSDDKPSWYYTIKKLIRSVDSEINIDFVSLNKVSGKLTEKNFLENILENYDAKTEYSLSKCMTLAKEKFPAGYEEIISRRGKGFIFNILSLNSSNHVHGPRNKNKATKALENLVTHLLGDYRELNCSFNALNELEIEIDNKLFNLTQILSHHPDYSHLELTQNQLDKYVQFFKSTQKYLTATDTSADKVNSHLHDGEKLAITLYTTNFFTQIQSFLRQDGKVKSLQRLRKDKLNSTVKDILLETCVASHGLAKPLDITTDNVKPIKYQTTYRKEYTQPNFGFFKQRKIAALKNSLISEKGFISTSSTMNGFVCLSNTYTVICEPQAINPIGKSVEKLSVWKAEKEVLYLPGTQFEYTDYVEYNNEHFFAARPIRTITELDSDYSSVNRAWHELEIIKLTLENFYNKNKHSSFRKLFDTVSNDKKRAYIKSVNDLITKTLDRVKSYDKLDQSSLEICRATIELAIKKHKELVDASTWPASLGNTHKVLLDALKRINYSLELMRQETNVQALTLSK